MCGKRNLILAALATVAVALALAPSASASAVSGSWGCSASSLYLDLGLGNLVAPLTSVGSTPCSDADAPLDQVGLLLSSLNITLADASVDDGATPDGLHTTPYDDTPTASSHVANVSLNALVPGLLTANAVQATVSGSCAGNNPAYTTTGFVTGISIGGTPLNLDPTLINQTVDVTNQVAGVTALLGVHATLYVNQVTTGHRTALRLVVSTDALGTLVDLRVADAGLSATDNGVHHLCTDLRPKVHLTASTTNRVVTADVTPVDDHTISSCSIAVGPVWGAELPGSYANGVCTAKIPNPPLPGSYPVRATATDNFGLVGTDTGSVTIVAPVVATPTLGADHRSLTATITPAPNAALTSCKFTLDSTTDVPGTLNANVCTAAGVTPGTYDVTATAIDENADSGTSSTATALVVLGVPVITSIHSPRNRHIAADVAPGHGAGAIASCDIALKRAAAFVSIGGTVDQGTCTATAPHADWPTGDYDVRVTATQNSTPTVDGTGTGTVTIGAPVVATPTISGGRTVNADVTPAAGTDVTACSVTFDGAHKTDGVVSSSTSACAATAPLDLQRGEYDVVVTAVDANTDTGSSPTGTKLTLDHSPAVPTVKLVDSKVNRKALADVTPPVGGTLSGCDLAIGATGGPYESLGGTLDAGHCKADVPSKYGAGAYELKATATDGEGDSASDVGPLTITAPTISAPTLTGHDLTGTITPAPGVEPKSCAFTLTPASGGTPITVPGTVAAGPVCRATTTAPDGKYTIEATVVDANGDNGKSSALAGSLATAIKSPPVTQPPTAGQQLTSCPGDRRIVLTDVRLVGSTVRVAGAAAPTLVGKTVSVRLASTGAVVATARVGSDGLFSAAASAPAHAQRKTAKYDAASGSDVSRTLRLTRRATALSIARSGGQITFRGKVAKPLNLRQKVQVQQLVSCGVYRTVTTVALKRNGTFAAAFAVPAGAVAGIYRAVVKVPHRANGPARNRTFTTPAPITLV